MTPLILALVLRVNVGADVQCLSWWLPTAILTPVGASPTFVTYCQTSVFDGLCQEYLSNRRHQQTLATGSQESSMPRRAQQFALAEGDQAAAEEPSSSEDEQEEEVTDDEQEDSEENDAEQETPVEDKAAGKKPLKLTLADKKLECHVSSLSRHGRQAQSMS